ncbi:putative sterol O-acyltransferase [Kockovaella imperatae]|uniref:O-acyltransferase n=1 Tax=Kockovaella imperatae TaxID=4999 RepID=A0A1Y1UMR5_9TREE|nr:putative sterol O-acyltransferase [Kockovaella imperatae]ORX39282.1 putative sterol O-acyltransferase [Kockovaella imperatae]
MVATRSSSVPRSIATPEDNTSTDMSSDSTAMATISPSSISHTSPSHIPVPGGEILVRPYRSSSNAQLKAVLSFEPRVSSLDRENVRSQRDEFRGFFTLFWIGLALLFLRTSFQSWEENHTPLSWTFGRLITRDAIVLAISDAVMSSTMFVCVIFVKCLQKQWFPYYYTGVIIQHILQTAYLFTAIWWGYHRQWYWVQAGFLVLHCLSNLMKMHSYMAHNGMLATVFLRLGLERKQLSALVNAHPGGREAAYAEAAAHKADLEAQEAATPIGTPSPISPSLQPVDSSSSQNLPLREGSNTTIDLEVPKGTGQSKSVDSNELRRRVASISHQQQSPRPPSKRTGTAIEALPKVSSGLPAGTSLEPSRRTRTHEAKAPSPLSWHPDQQIAILARNIDAMEDELKSNGALGLVWPQNVTFKHFFEYMSFPTLVYQLEYPRTNEMRPLVVIEKVIATFGTFSLIYLITEHYILPYTPRPDEPLFRSFINLALPMMVNYLLIFYIIFECVCAGFAELSYFADREFYQDWWNSTSWDQFSRKWNKPVHTFLLRHVYASTIDGFQLSKTSATFVTFLLSALCHELVMAVVTKKIRPYLFLMQMAQLPMIYLGKVPAIKRNKTLGNIVFWVGLMCGFPLLAVGYLRY